MPREPIDVLKRGLSKFVTDTKARKDGLLAKVSRGETITDEEEHWLDHDSNTVDEVQLIERLEKAKDYEKALGALTENEKETIRRLRVWAGDVKKDVGKKRTRPESEGHEQPPKKKKPAEREPPKFTHKENATLQQRIEILDWYHKNGKSQTKTAKHFDPIYPNLRIKQPLVSDWLKNEEYWRTKWAEVNRKSDRTAKRARQTEHPEVSDMMDVWITQAMGDGVLLTGEVLRKQWVKFANLQGIPTEKHLRLSGGWLDSLKRRHELKERRCHGEAGSAKPETVEGERKRVQDLIRERGFQPRDIFNMDETGLFYGIVPDRGLSNTRQSGVKSNKTRMTYALTTNADGSEKRRTFIIGKAARPKPFNKKSGEALGFYYRHTANAWMNTSLYQEWLSAWDAELNGTGRKILLLQDNFSGHIPPDSLNNITVENFEPNLTAHVQPMDQGIIRCFKAHYRSRFIERALDRYDEGIPPANIYDIDQLQAMRLAEQAWREVDVTTIRNCWRKAGILPDFNSAAIAQPSVPVASLLNVDDDPLAAAEKEVERALDDLEAIGMVHRRNRMDIESLLNPPEEKLVAEKMSDEEIMDAVIKARDGKEADNDEDADGDPAPEPLPSLTDVLKASTTITRYLATMDSELARKLEGSLGSLNREIRLARSRSAQPQLITNFFDKK